MKIKRILFMIIICSVVLINCTGPNGDAYLKYWWAGSLGYINDTNPSTPHYIYKDVYFQTNPGKFYLEYEAFDGSEWYMYYTITINKGSFLVFPGDDLWFEIGLYSTGPTLYKWTERNAKMSKNIEDNSTVFYQNTLTNKSRRQGPIIGEEKKSTKYGDISISFGKLE